MAFWYNGKPDPDVYQEWACMHIIKNLARSCNESSQAALHAARLKGAILIMNAIGYDVKIGMESVKIFNIRFHNKSTDEVWVFEIIKRKEGDESCQN